MHSNKINSTEMDFSLFNKMHRQNFKHLVKIKQIQKRDIKIYFMFSKIIAVSCIILDFSFQTSVGNKCTKIKMKTKAGAKKNLYQSTFLYSSSLHIKESSFIAIFFS
jgi:hypothetical protein